MSYVANTKASVFYTSWKRILRYRVYLGGNFLVLDALVSLSFQLVLDLPWKVGLASKTVGDTVAGNLVVS
jgi:hypothetical protein